MSSQLSIMEFKDYLKELKGSVYIFDSENQENNDVSIRIYFDDVQITFNPNMICFSGNNGRNHILLKRVKYITISKSVLGTVLKITTGNIKDNIHDSDYVIIAQNK